MKQRIALLAILFVFAAVSVFAQAPTKIGADKCMPCHKIQHTSWQKTKHAAAKVECEDCHGAGSAYKTLAIMKDKAKAKAAGLIMPTEKDCQACHAKKNVKVENYAEAMKKVHDKKPAAK
jgi:RecJ-like exonuclease